MTTHAPGGEKKSHAVCRCDQAQRDKRQLTRIMRLFMEDMSSGLSGVGGSNFDAGITVLRQFR